MYRRLISAILLASAFSSLAMSPMFTASFADSPNRKAAGRPTRRGPRVKPKKGRGGKKHYRNR